MSINEIVFGIIMPISLFGVLIWGFKPMYDRTSKDIERHNREFKNKKHESE